MHAVRIDLHKGLGGPAARLYVGVYRIQYFHVRAIQQLAKIYYRS